MPTDHISYHIYSYKFYITRSPISLFFFFFYFFLLFFHIFASTRAPSTFRKLCQKSLWFDWNFFFFCLSVCVWVCFSLVTLCFICVCAFYPPPKLASVVGRRVFSPHSVVIFNLTCSYRALYGANCFIVWFCFLNGVSFHGSRTCMFHCLRR